MSNLPRMNPKAVSPYRDCNRGTPTWHCLHSCRIGPTDVRCPRLGRNAQLTQNHIQQICHWNMFCLLCSRFNRPHYGSCPSVRPPVCLSASYWLNSETIQTKRRRETKIGVNIPQVDFQLKRSKGTAA